MFQKFCIYKINKTEEQERLMLKQIAWNTFKNTGDINTFMDELKKLLK